MKSGHTSRIKLMKVHTSCQCTGQQANYPAARKIFPALFDDVEKSFSYNEVQCKKFYLPQCL